MPRYHAMWSVGAAVGALIGALAASLGLGLTTHFAIAAAIGCGGSILIVLRWFVDDREPAVAHVEVVDEADGSTTW